ncbi:MAG TPA: glycosyltransferase [Bosea sp. (in: a-proteobacteria)]|jgi:glycosyltransferase involved in cell wall biosynthesis|uniref:glycosyltransferase family 2 protein n=1 Tax=Bosea sp. (in: a-proteobacteria) TaxID=1871050 RepID=UPI002E10C8BF|nr:glycosyltransferase [Bosea sp. (in: a-proteobacteria)]
MRPIHEPQEQGADSWTGTDIRAAILIPAYGQPWLTAEALRSALAQVTDFAYAIIVVNDGCPHPETAEVCQTFAASHPGQIFHLHKRNGGLSAARNTGIEFALAAFPDLEAVYFLDCDNRIGPHLLQRLLTALRNADANVGWAYPDVDKFGFAEFADTSGPYSPLEHLFRNFCEAGSMVSRRMLDASIRFDTGMRQGVEDWEFWLHGLEHGFRGVHVADAGFAYRRRGESMLVAAERDFVPILRYIRSRHPRLFNLRNVLAFEAEARSRYAVYHPDTGLVRCFTELNDVEILTRDAYIRRLLRAQLRPAFGHCPGQLIIMSSAVFDALVPQSLLAGVLWTLECGLTRSTFVACSLQERSHADHLLAWTAATIAQEPTDIVRLPAAAIHLLAVEASFVAEQAAFRKLDLHALPRQHGKYHQAIELDLAVAGAPIGPEPIAEAFAGLCRDIAATGDEANLATWKSAAPNRYRLQTALPRDVYPELFDLNSAFACGSTEARPRAVLVLASATPESVAIAARLARVFADEGWEVDLVTLKKDLALAPEHARCFSQIVVLPLPQLLSRVWARSYQGTKMPCFDPPDMNDAVATLAGYHRAVSVDGGVSHTVMGALRRLKVETWALLGYCESDQAASEAVNACSAFEQAYASIVVGNAETLRLCRAFGMPDAKMRCWPDHGTHQEFEELGIKPIIAGPSTSTTRQAV